MRGLRNLVKRNFKKVFELSQRLGVDVLPRHFYSSIPDFRALRKDDRWRRAHDMTGVSGANLDEQESALREIMNDESRAILSAENVYEDACRENGEVGYGPADADVLFAFARARRPKKIVQIGCGVSTAMIRRACSSISLTCVDPYPTPMLQRLAHEKKIELIAEKAEHVDETRLSDLSTGDMLFVDSSHTTKPGSDVHHVIFRVLPRLPAGVWIHFHDINFPYDFGPNILGPGDLFFGGESGLLHAFLINNGHCCIAFSMSMLHHGRPELLGQLLPHYTPVASDRGVNPAGFEGMTPSATYLLTH